MENKPLKEEISQHNAQAYMDMAKDILKKNNGLYSFVIKIDSKNVIDYIQMDSLIYTQWKTK